MTTAGYFGYLRQDESAGSEQPSSPMPWTLARAIEELLPNTIAHPACDEATEAADLAPSVRQK
jgi:hypothetical protein